MRRSSNTGNEISPRASLGRDDKRQPASTFKIGAIALAFLIIGYESALFVHRAAVLRIESLRDHPDTVYIIERPVVASGTAGQEEVGATVARAGHSTQVTVRKNAHHSEPVERIRQQTRKIESFRFDPNTVSMEDLQRLGFTEKQAQSIINYREAGGRFRRPSDFARSYVVADSVFERLQPYIDIPQLDINTADSAAFDALPGIGPYYAAKMVEYRRRLHGYSYPGQLMDIWKFDQEKFDALKDLITCSAPEPYPLWNLPEDSLRLHPYIRSRQAAHAIVLFRANTPKEGWSVEAIQKAGILSEEDAGRLGRCRIADPD